MKNIIDKLHQLELNRLATRLKHLRGRHDQLDHAWNRGMGRGGGGADLAPNQIGPLPTQDFYRQRRIELMDQRRQGTITRAEMRRQLDEMQGKIPKNNVVQPTTASASQPMQNVTNTSPVTQQPTATSEAPVVIEIPTRPVAQSINATPVSTIDASLQPTINAIADSIFSRISSYFTNFFNRFSQTNTQSSEEPISQIDTQSSEEPISQTDTQSSEEPISQTITQQIDQFKAERDAERLPKGFDIYPYKNKMQRTWGGASGVQEVPINGKVYYYRPNPSTSGRMQWSFLRGTLKALVADNIASSLGLPLAPIAQQTSDYFMITNSLSYDAKIDPGYAQLQLQEKFDKGEISFDQLIGLMEPLAVMDLIIGQNDGHSGNINVIKNPNRSLYDSEYIATSVDYDLTGSSYINSTALTFLSNALKNHSSPDRTLLTPAIQELLTQFIQNPQWHPDIPERARAQYMRRAEAVLQMGKMTIAQLKENQLETLINEGNIDLSSPLAEELLKINPELLLINAVNNVSTSLTPQDELIRDAVVNTDFPLSLLTSDVSNLKTRTSEYEFMTQALGFPAQQILSQIESLQQQLVQSASALAENISDTERDSLLQQHADNLNNANRLIATAAVLEAMATDASTPEYKKRLASPRLQSNDTYEAKKVINDNVETIRWRFEGPGRDVYYNSDGSVKTWGLSLEDQLYKEETQNAVSAIVSQIMALAQSKGKLADFLSFMVDYKLRNFSKIMILNSRSLSSTVMGTPDEINKMMREFNQFAQQL